MPILSHSLAGMGKVNIMLISGGFVDRQCVDWHKDAVHEGK
jgi:hypothetical protein